MGEGIQGFDGSKYNPLRLDKSTHVLSVIDYEHHEIHAGSFFSAYDTTANIGAETTPADAIQLTWLTPAVKEVHMVIHAKCTAAAVFTFTEAWTGGAGGGAAVVAYNRDRNSNKTSGMTIAKENTAVVTGGTVLVTETITTGKFDAGESRSSQEWILKKSTKYAAAVFLNGAGIATISLDWYEHTNLTD